MIFGINDILKSLERTPKVLKEMLHDVSEEIATSNEGGETWSPIKVLKHLLHGDQTYWLKSIAFVLTHGEQKSFRSFDRKRQFDGLNDYTINEMLGEFEKVRRSNIASLKDMKLKDSELSVKGNHDYLGSVTVSHILTTWMVHDLGHIIQISRVTAKQYKGKVGAWEPYLKVLE